MIFPRMTSFIENSGWRPDLLKACVSLFIHLAYIVYKNIQPHVENRSTYAQFTRIEVEYRFTATYYTDDNTNSFYRYTTGIRSMESYVMIHVMMS